MSDQFVVMSAQNSVLTIKNIYINLSTEGGH